MIGRGSSDPDANSDFCELVRLFDETSPYARTDFGFIGVTEPRVEVVLARLIQERPETLILQPYLLFAGELIEKLKALVMSYAKSYPRVTIKIAETLGEDPLLFDLLKERAFDVEHEDKPLPC